MSDSFNGWGSQPIPYSQEAEEAVLGAILVNPSAFVQVSAFLGADDFFILRHKYIWQAIKRLAERSEPFDYVTIIQSLREIDKLAEIGGPAYLTQLINSTPTSVHAEVYGRLVERAATRRRLMAASDEMKALALNEELTIEEVIAEADRKLLDVTGRKVDTNQISHMEAVSNYFTRIESLTEGKAQMLGLATGFKDLDHLLLGIAPTNLVTVGGRPGMGKSSFLQGIALNNMLEHPEMVFGMISIEMGLEEIVAREISIVSALNSQTLKAGTLTSGEWGKFVEASGKVAKLNFAVNDRSAITPSQIRSQAYQWLNQYGRLDALMIDYIQLVSGGDVFKGKDRRYEEVSYVSRSMKELAREIRVPVFQAAQLSRALESRQDKRPQLSDLKESGQLEQDSDIVIFLYRDEVYNPATEFPGQAEAIVGKHRNGPTGTAYLYFEKTLTKFSNAMEVNVDLSYLGANPVSATPYDPSEKD